MNKKSLGIIVGCIVLAVILFFLGKELYTMNYNRNNYADTMWKQFNPQVISIDNIATNQIFDFTQGQTYLIEGSMSDLKNKALNLELISDEVNYDGAIPVNLMSCKHDLIGKEYCQFVGLFSLRSRYVQHRQPNEVVGSIECLLVDPYGLQEQNDSCYTVRHNEAYIGVSQINVPKLWSQGNNNWKLLINQGIQPNKLSTTLSVRKI